jgi:tellurite resistance protein/uncharacterized protein (DUF697 family)
MLPSDRDSTTALCLLAAMADGALGPAEQARIQATVAAIAAADSANSAPGADVYQRVMLGQTDMAREAANISSPELRRQAYELAVAVCASDGATSDAERAYLSRLASALGVDASQAGSVISQADQIAGASAAGAGGGAGLGAGIGSATAVSSARPSDAALDDMIVNAAILNGALELLPQSLASMAIIPLQMRLVYRIGEKYGYSLDRGHITEFLGVLGVGATSQVIESVAGRLLGGLLGSVGKQVLGGTVGGLAGAFGRTAGGAAVSFASTYALGQVARQYYAGGRKISAVDLQSLFNAQVGSAQQLATRYIPQIQSRAQSLNPAQLVSLARGEIGI